MTIPNHDAIFQKLKFSLSFFKNLEKSWQRSLSVLQVPKRKNANASSIFDSHSNLDNPIWKRFTFGWIHSILYWVNASLYDCWLHNTHYFLIPINISPSSEILPLQSKVIPTTLRSLSNLSSALFCILCTLLPIFNQSQSPEAFLFTWCVLLKIQTQFGP